MQNAYCVLIFLQTRMINACCVLHNFIRDRQHMMDDLLLEEVDNELAAQPIEAEDDVGWITTIQVTNVWKKFRKQFVDDICRLLYCPCRTRGIVGCVG